jgi:hypothetical protein
LALLSLLSLPFVTRSEVLFRPPNRGRYKLLLAVTASISLTFLIVRAAKVNKLSPNEGSVSFDGRYLFDDTLIEGELQRFCIAPYLYDGTHKLPC